MDKGCCTFYESPHVRLFFHDIFHPGGQSLTRKLADETELRGKRVLDLACGTGTTARLLNKEYQAKVIGIDGSEKNITQAQEQSDPDIEYILGNIEQLPPLPPVDVALAECSLCLTDRQKTLVQIKSLLPSGGRLGITDFVVHDLPENFQSILFEALCIAKAPTSEQLRQDLEQADFTILTFENQKTALLDTIEILKKRLFLAEISGFLKKVDLSKYNLSPKDIRPLLEEARTLIEDGRLSYVLAVAEA